MESHDKEAPASVEVPATTRQTAKRAKREALGVTKKESSLMKYKRLYKYYMEAAKIMWMALEAIDTLPNMLHPSSVDGYQKVWKIAERHWEVRFKVMDFEDERGFVPKPITPEPDWKKLMDPYEYVTDEE